MANQGLRDRKRCSKCAHLKSVDKFYSQKGRRGRATRGMSECKTCHNQRSREYHNSNKEKLRQLAAQRYRLNSTHRIEKVKLWQRENREKTKGYLEKWRAANKLTTSRWNAIYYLRIKDRQREYQRKWIKLNPTKVAAKNSRRRARLAGVEGTHSAADIARLRECQKDKCAACRCKLNGRGEVDHIIPIISRGSNAPSNLQMLCMPCNRRKWAKGQTEFMRSMGKLL